MVEANDLEIAFNALIIKKTVYDTLWRYYDGDHILKYSTERLQEVFGTKLAKFVENWCAVVVDTAWERLELLGFDVGTNIPAKARLAELWKVTEMDLDARTVHLSALVTGEAFVLVWPDSEDNIQAYYNDARLCYIRYDEENPRKKKWAAKWWRTDGGRYRLNLYYPDGIKYFTTEQMKQLPSAHGAFKPTEEAEAPNPYEQIPVFHFRRSRRAITSELTTSILSMQDATDKLLTDLMITAEFGAFPQRFIISSADVTDLKNAPNEIWGIPAGDGVSQAAQVGQLAAAQLDNYVSGIAHVIGAVSSISRTPRHFFFGSTGQLSGEALIALEAPLNKKCERYTAGFGNTWQRVAAFMLRLDGTTVNPEEISVIWSPVETVQPRTTSEIRKIDVEAGIPLKTAVHRAGWTEAEIEQMDKDRAEEAASSSASLARALMEQQREFDQAATTEEGEGEEEEGS